MSKTFKLIDFINAVKDQLFNFRWLIQLVSGSLRKLINGIKPVYGTVSGSCTFSRTVQTLGFKIADTCIQVGDQVLFENSADFKNSGELLIDMIDNFIKQSRSEDKGADKLPELLL